MWVYYSSVLHLSKLMLEHALAGHRFDVDTPIAETVRESMSEVNGIIC